MSKKGPKNPDTIKFPSLDEQATQKLHDMLRKKRIPEQIIEQTTVSVDQETGMATIGVKLELEGALAKELHRQLAALNIQLHNPDGNARDGLKLRDFEMVPIEKPKDRKSPLRIHAADDWRDTEKTRRSRPKSNEID